MTALRPTSGLVHGMLLDGRGGGELLDWNGIANWRPADGLLWIDLDYAAPDAERWLGLEAGLERHTREALVASDPRPRAEQRGDALVLIARGVNLTANAEPEDMVSMRAWIDAGRIITMRHRDVRALTTIAAHIGSGNGPRSVGEFVVALIDEILAPVAELVDDIGDRVASLEDAALGSDLTAPRTKIADLRRRAIALRRFIGPQRDALTRLAHVAVPWLSETQRSQLRDAAERQARTVEELDAARDRAAVTHEELAARVDELANRRLYVLSLVTALFLPLSFVTGLLGVNVGGVPAQDVSWAFWALCGGFAMMAAGQFWLLRRLRWL
jgi:zinc transporter